jgi:hypothetical protein
MDADDNDHLLEDRENHANMSGWDFDGDPAPSISRVVVTRKPRQPA